MPPTAAAHPVAVAALAFLGALLLTPLLRSGARHLGLLDHPNSRSSHTRVTPRAGGLALLIAAGLGLLAAGRPVLARSDVGAFLAGCLMLALVGLWDDRRGLHPFVRLAFQTMAAAALVWHTGGLARLPLPSPLDLSLGSVGVGLAIVWVVAIVNFYNFMDGIDGLAGVQAVVTGLGLAAAGLDPWVTLVGLALAAASAGFLLFNWSPATIFLGDAGSGVLGYAFAALPLLAPPGLREAGVRLAALSLAFFVGDALFTLCRRVARGERFYEAHREHLYQRLVISGLSHARVSLTLGLGAAVLTVAAVSALGSGTVAVAWTVTLLALLLISLEIGWVAARERESLR